VKPGLESVKLFSVLPLRVNPFNFNSGSFLSGVAPYFSTLDSKAPVGLSRRKQAVWVEADHSLGHLGCFCKGSDGEALVWAALLAEERKETCIGTRHFSMGTIEPGSLCSVPCVFQIFLWRSCSNSKTLIPFITRCAGSTPDQLNQNLWGWIQASVYFVKIPQVDSNVKTG
jgi:hypothetical protein